MRLSKAVLLGVAICGTFLFASSQAAAQDPAVVNAKFIRVQLDNARVRVFEATLEPGAKEQLHSHPATVVHVFTGGRMRSHSPDGKVTESELVAGQTLYREPLTHWAENIGSTTIHLIVVELKDPNAE